MSTFLDAVEQEFGSRDLYLALGVGREAGEKEMRKAYHRMSLRIHPDRVESGEVAEATNKFQSLGKIYSILTDKDKRAIYDEDGTVDEEDSSIFKQDRDWLEYWRLVFKKVSSEDILSFTTGFKGSEEEAEELRAAYLKFQGDMDQIMEEVLCATLDDEPRFRELLWRWIAEGTLEQFPAFVCEPKAKKNRRKRKMEEEAVEAEKVLKEMGRDQNGDSLKNLILARQESREAQMGDFFDSLEEKYCKKTNPGSSSKPQGKKASGGRRKKGRK